MPSSMLVAEQEKDANSLPLWRNSSPAAQHPMHAAAHRLNEALKRLETGLGTENPAQLRQQKAKIDAEMSGLRKKLEQAEQRYRNLRSVVDQTVSQLDLLMEAIPASAEASASAKKATKSASAK